MDKQWSYSTDSGTTWRVFEPVNGAKLKIREKAAELEKGQAFKRKEISGNVTIGGADFTYLNNIERRGSQRCNEILMRVEFKCGYAWNEFWRGKFSPGSGEWDLDNCLVDVKPETVDRYTCLLEKEKVKRNILQAGVVTATAVSLPSLEFGICNTSGFTPSPAGSCDDFFGPGGSPSDPTIDGWDSATTSIPGVNCQANFYWRERIVTECVGGGPASPPGVGWTLLTDNCATDGTAVYVRQPVISWPFGTPVAGTLVAGEPIPPDSTCEWIFLGLGDCDDPFTPGDDRVPYYACLNNATGETLSRARTLQSAAEYIIDQAACDVSGIRSDFFEWNAVGDADGYVAGTNYITGEASQVNALCILQKSDVIDPTASNPATIGEMTWAELMQTLNVMFRVYWDIDDDGYVRIEHWHYWTFQQGLDLTTTSAQRIEPQKYKHLNDEIPRIERATFMESQSRDFVGKDITYAGPCARSEEVKEWSPGKVTTDVTFILNDPTAISKEGFVILATSFNGTEYATIIDYGAITGNYQTNAQLSWANLQRDFWQWDRYLIAGNMNGVDTTFDGILPNVEQGNVRLTMCCELLVFDASKTVKTKLCTTLGIANASIEDVEYDLPVDRVVMTLRYAY